MAYNGTVTTNTLPLRIRKGPSTSTSILGRIPKGANIIITEVSDQPGGWKWGKVTYNGISGWCCIIEPGVGTWVKLEIPAPPTPTPAPTPPQEPKIDDNDLAAQLLSIMNKRNNYDTSYQTLNGSGVQYESDKIGTMGISDEVEFTIINGEKVYKSSPGINDTNEPKYVQNANHFPPVAGYVNGSYRYNYYMDYSDMENEFEAMRTNLNLNPKSRRSLYLQNVNTYNRFKVANPNNELSKSFAHVFFIRPDLNILSETSSTGVVDLSDTLKNDASMYYALHHSPELLKQLTHNNGETHDFMFMLSNAANSFEISDEYIKTDTYGDSYTGFKIPIGKHNNESKTSGTFNITYQDDRDLHIYHLHKIWTDYISAVFRGQIKSKDTYIKNKIIDYASAVYYILTAEDGETIIFWSKYYGVFPTNSPSSVTSWSKGNLLHNPQYTVNYTYAFKEDFNPLTLVEFNMHSPKEALYKYVKTYNSSLLSTGNTTVGAPFIETFNGTLDIPYTFKLRFRKAE